MKGFRFLYSVIKRDNHNLTERNPKASNEENEEGKKIRVYTLQALLLYTPHPSTYMHVS
jgi:hypothetical protein